MSRRNLALVGLAVVAYLVFFRKHAPAGPMRVSVDVGAVEGVRYIA